MDCSKTGEKLVDYFYGELGVANEAEIKVHINACPLCKSEYGKLEEVRLIFSHIPVLESPPSSLDKILAFAYRFERERPKEKTGGKPGGIFSAVVKNICAPRSMAPVTVAVCLFVALLISFFEAGPPDETQGPASPFASIIEPTIGPFTGTALRERLLENPFADRAPFFGVPNTPLGFAPDSGDASAGKGPLLKEVLSPDYGSGPAPSLNVSDLEKIYEQRHRALLESDADSLMMRGRRLKSMGHIDLALKDFETIYLFYPDYSYMSDVLMYRAQCYALLGDAGKAVESLKMVIKKYPAKKDLVLPLIDQLSSPRIP